MKPTRATRINKDTVLLKEAEGGMRRIRCPKCQVLAAPVTKADGRKVYQCGGCGAQFNSMAL